MGCGVSKRPIIDASSVRSKDINNNSNGDNNQNHTNKNSILSRRRDKNRSTVNQDRNVVPESAKVATNKQVSSVQFNIDSAISSIDQQSSSFVVPPSTPHPKVRLLPRQLSCIDEASYESTSNSTTAPSTSDPLAPGATFDSIACQTEITKSSVMTQTDPLPTPEEELEMLINCEYDFPDNFCPSLDSGQGSSINGSSMATHNNDNNQSLDRCDSSLMVISTRKGKNKLADFFEDYEISKRVVAPEEKFVDVAIQVAQVLTSCSTQTNFGGRGSGNNGKPDSGIKTEQGQPIQRLTENPLKDGEQDEEDNRLFHRLSNNLPIDLQRATSPTTMWAEVLNSNHNSNSYQHNNNIDQLNNSDVNNNVDPRFNGIADQSIVLPKRHDFESQTDPVSEVLAANAGDNDLNVLQSYSLSSPFSHIEKQLANDSDSDPLRAEKNVINKINDTTNDIKLQECLNKLLDDIEGSFSFENKKVRGIFRWIAHNIRYNWNYMGISVSSEEILRSREGVCKDYCQLFGDMCFLAGIRVKKIQGFAKGYDYRPGHQFVPGEDITHNWNAVFILGSWRFIDLTWGTGYTDHSGKFQRKLNEHFFLTDPETMIWTHFPYNELEDNYSRWQLLDKPLTLEEFNTLPKVTPYFFEFNLKIRSKLANPINFRVQAEIKIGGHEAMRYKYKLYPADEVENASLNHYVFCQLKEDRMVGSFLVTPPIEGRYFLKVYARPEKDMGEWNIDATTALPPPPMATSSSGQSTQSNLHSCVTFLLECSRSRKYLQPYPLNELPWGPTQSFYNYKMRLLNQNGPVVTTWGGKRRLVLESSEPMLITYQVLDAEGMEMDAKNLLIREDNGNKITFTISPPRLGMFKLMIFGMPKPKQKGKWRLPLLATFLIECKMAKIAKQPPEEEDPPPIVVDYVEPSMEYDVYRQKFSRPIIR
uniref:Transglutaminase-like domain-containing protein n=1 Tax=Tetranychus urticae TaxID=32264 RepID=T1KRA8_TETUR